jgi:hypothetical protein
LLLQLLTKQAQGRVRIKDPVCQQLLTFKDLLHKGNQATQVGDPVNIGAYDIVKSDMGGVWFPALGPPYCGAKPLMTTSKTEWSAKSNDGATSQTHS